MADSDSGSPAATQGGPGAAPDSRPQLGIQSQYIKDLSFENPGAPESLVQTGTPPDITVNVQVEARPMRESIYEVALQITADAKQDGKSVFLLELTYSGVFTVMGVPQDALQLVLLVECPRILFPFARRVVADTARDGGFPPLLLSPIDFLSLFRERQAQASAQGGTGAAAT
jgi:preprotein translocase subunit SecB